MVDVRSNNNTVRVGVSSGDNISSVEAESATSTLSVEASSDNSKYYEELAKQYSLNAAASATSASNSATSASNSATSASTNKDNAKIWAEGTDAQVSVLGGEHSAKGWQSVIENSAPTATVTKSGTVSTLTVTDINGTTTTTINDGTNGSDGEDGDDGFSPIATVTKTGNTATITITDAQGTTTAEIYDGTSAVSFSNITGQPTDNTNLATALNGKQATLVSGTNIKTINNTSILGSGDISISGSSVDVQINGTSITSGGVANIPYGTNVTLGAVSPVAAWGIASTQGKLLINKADNSMIDAKTDTYCPIVPANLDYAVKKGVTANANTLSDSEKVSAKGWLGINDSIYISNTDLSASGTITLTDNVVNYTSVPTAATTYTFDTSSLTSIATKIVTFELFIDISTTAYTLTFPATVSWLNSETPDLSSTGKYILAFRTYDGGTSWVGSLEGKV